MPELKSSSFGVSYCIRSSFSLDYASLPFCERAPGLKLDRQVVQVYQNSCCGFKVIVFGVRLYVDSGFHSFRTLLFEDREVAIEVIRFIVITNLGRESEQVLKGIV